MAIFEYKAIDHSGSNRSGIVDADSPREARTKLRQDGIHVVQIEQIQDKSKGKGGKGGESTVGSLFAPKADPRQLAIVTRQMATLNKAGISVVDGLKALIDQVESREMEKVLRDVREKITSGDTLAEAMGQHPRFFGNLYVNMVKAGEASGQLDTIMVRLSDYITRANRLKSKITSALIYPFVMVLVGVLVVTILMTLVVPKLTTLFTKVGSSLPAITRALIGVSEFFQSYWWLMIVAGFGIWVFVKGLRKTSAGRMRLDRILMGVPVLGDLVRKAAIARFANTTSTLLQSGISVLESLRIVKEVVSNEVLAKTIDEVHDAILEGSDIATPLQESGVFPPMVGYMIATGEQSGQLEELLTRIAESYDEEIDTATQRLTSVLEPLIIIILAAVVLFVVAAIIFPMMQMGSLARGR